MPACSETRLVIDTPALTQKRAAQTQVCGRAERRAVGQQADFSHSRQDKSVAEQGRARAADAS